MKIIVGVGLLALLGYMAMEWVTVTARNTARDAAIAETVADYKVLVRAATEYVAEQQGSWSPGSSHTITIATLEAAGKLPAGFATRAYGAGRTVYGAPFRIVSIRNPLEPGSKTVIGDAPTDNQAAFEALGWNYTAAQALAAKRAVAAALAADGLPVATTPAGSSTAKGGGSNLDKSFEYLERSYQQHDGLMATLQVEPQFDPLRSDPRFDELVRRVGLK